MLLRIGSTMAGLLATGIPIVFGLRPDLNEEFTHNNTTDTTQGQLELIHGQMAALQQQLTQQSQQLIEQSQQLAELTVLNRTIMLMRKEGCLNHEVLTKFELEVFKSQHFQIKQINYSQFVRSFFHALVAHTWLAISLSLTAVAS